MITATEVVPAVNAGQEEVRTRSEAILRQANELAVPLGDAAAFTQANEYLGRIKTGMKLLDTTFDPGIKRWHEGHKAAVAQKNTFAVPFNSAEVVVKDKLLAWKKDETRRLEIERQRLQAVADAEAKKERDRLQAIAQKDAEDRRAEEAAELKRQGDAKAAAALLRKPVEVERVEMPESAPIAAPAPTKAEGASFKKEWHYEIVDALKLPRMYTIPDDVKIGKTVKALGAEARISGVRVFQRDAMARRA